MFFNCLEKPKCLWSLLKPIKFTFLHLPRLPLLETLCRSHRGSPLNEKEYIYYLCGAVVYICRYTCGITCVEIRRHFSRVSRCSFSILSVSGIEFWSSVLVASAFTGCAISLAPPFPLPNLPCTFLVQLLQQPSPHLSLSFYL